MKTQLYLAAAVIVSLLAQSAVASTGGQTPNATDNWDAVKSVSVAAELEIKLADGKSVKGRHISANDSEMVLSAGKVFKQIGRDQVKRVYVVVPNSRGNVAAKGAAFGSLLALGGVAGVCDSSECIPPAAAMFSLGILGAGIGAAIGFIVAKPHKRVLIYEVK